MELRRQVLIQELQLQGRYVTDDGRLIAQLTLNELETEKMKFDDKVNRS